MAPVMVFLISSPLMSPSAFFITLGGLGLSIALWKLTSAVALGLAAGWMTDRLAKRGYFGNSILRFESAPSGQNAPESCSTTECGVQAENSGRARAEEIRTFLRLTWRFSLFIGKFILIAVIAQAVVVRFVPPDWVMTAVGTKNAYGVLYSTVIGIPAYISSISAVPLLRGFMDLGMDKGAVLAFIIAGPVMSVPSILAVTALFRRRALYVYMMVGFMGAILFGYTYRLF